MHEPDDSTALPQASPPFREGDIPLARPAVLWPVATSVPSDPMLLTNMSVWRAAANLAILLAAGAAYMIGAGVFVHLAGLAPDDQVAPGTKLDVAVAGGVLLAAVALYLVRRARCRPAALGLSRARMARNVLWGLVATVGSFAAFFGAVGLIMVAWPRGYSDLTRNAERIRELVPPTGIAAGLGLMAVIATYEEILFRGFLLTHVRRLTGSWTAAVVLVTVMFGALHLPDQQAVAVILLVPVAVLWSVFTIWRRSLIPAIVAHMLFNSFHLLALRTMR